ncbi:DUF4870 domain-containing protein [Hyunsoonleella rubra]|uniref:DUF4870 domain-containing protein n=1 Tax=Hyunsoonleella rubra TaxID=1737062 RepID=A0ABW5TE88_9FLAO
MTQQEIQEGKTFAIVAYITFIGLIVAIIKNLNQKNPFTAFHVRQMIGLVLLLIFSNLTEKYVNSWLGTMLWFGTFILWVYGIITAVRGEAKLIPFFGKLFQEWFQNIGK